MLFDHGQKRVVGGAVALLKNMLKISSRLVSMNNQQKMEWRARLGHRVHIP
jgi:hypothetical protein